jgi:acyl-CoA reductase-like NAD-dependent aldehyde dehydrogenase
MSSPTLIAFQSSVFSSDIGPALRAAKRLDALAVMINDRSRVDWVSFPGCHLSRNSFAALLSHEKTVKWLRRRDWTSITVVFTGEF